MNNRELSLIENSFKILVEMQSADKNKIKKSKFLGKIKSSVFFNFTYLLH